MRKEVKNLHKSSVHSADNKQKKKSKIAKNVSKRQPRSTKKLTKQQTPQGREAMTRLTTFATRESVSVLNEKKKKSNKITGDVSILILTVLLALFGILAVYSASRYVAQTQYGDEWYFVKKQALGFVLGIVAMLFCARLDYALLKGKKLRWIALILPIILLALVFVPGIGKSNYGATRWIGIGSFTIQPSELAKYGFVIFASAYMSENMAQLRTFKGVLPVLICGGIICVLIILEPNMSVTMCVGLLMLAMLFLGGMKIKHFLIIFIPALLVVPVLIIAEPYRLSRLSAFLDPWESPRGEGYQLIQSLYALGNGGWFGAGLFNSRQKYRFLPFAESDFILSIIGEELGFVGVFLLFLVCAVLIFRGIKVSEKAEDFFSFLLSSGIILVYGIQTVINAMVVSGSIPPTGLPLPLISSGNTSLIITMASMGILYSVSANGAQTKNKKRKKYIQ
ncbi:MAG: putative lipid II flippase FtsW [Clostridiales bacterium]|nr:putative lipid II flippase FtsW [Clostridiales bacterium]